MCFSIGEFDMKVSRLLFASLLCGVIGVDVMAFNEGNAEVNDGSQEQDAEDIDQGRAHGGPADGEDVDQQAFPPHAFDGGMENYPHVVQERQYGALTRVQLDITRYVHDVLDIANAVRAAIAGHIFDIDKDRLGKRFTEICSLLKQLGRVVLVFSCEHDHNNKLKISDFIYNVHGLISDMHYFTYRIYMIIADLDFEAPGQHTISINGVNGVNCRQIIGSYFSIFGGLLDLASLANKGAPSASGLKSVSKYMNNLLHILNELKANPQNASNMHDDILRLNKDIWEFCRNGSSIISAAPEFNGNQSEVLSILNNNDPINAIDVLNGVIAKAYSIAARHNIPQQKRQALQGKISEAAKILNASNLGRNNLDAHTLLSLSEGLRILFRDIRDELRCLPGLYRGLLKNGVTVGDFLHKIENVFIYMRASAEAALSNNRTIAGFGRKYMPAFLKILIGLTTEDNQGYVLASELISHFREHSKISEHMRSSKHHQ
jgi:hypothetical protein